MLTVATVGDLAIVHLFVDIDMVPCWSIGDGSIDRKSLSHGRHTCQRRTDVKEKLHQKDIFQWP
jgi:hypothetical protein